MRAVDALETVVVDEELASLQELARVLPSVQHLNVSALQLRNLNIAHNAIACIQEVAPLARLRVLKCSHNEIADLSWVSGLLELRELWTHHNRVESAQIAHLQSLRQLQTLVLHPNPCTELSYYVLDVVRALPWLERLDTVVVDEALRAEAQHAAERETLCSGSTDYSISLLSGRSDDSKPPTPALPSPPMQALKPQAALKKKKTKQEIAEEFMRNFPVQDYIPVQENERLAVQNHEPRGSQDAAGDEEPKQPSHELQSATDINDEPSSSPESAEPAVANQAAVQQDAAPPSPVVKASSISSIASAVLSLPTFTSDGFLSKQQPSHAKPKPVPLNKKKSAASKAAVKPEESDGNTAAFRQDEWLLTYPSTAIVAVQIRSDGSAIAKWPNGTIAVSVDREGAAGFRIYAAHKDGQIALSFDSSGVGFINYHPSGKMLISTTSSGDGLYFSSDGAILRQWDGDLNIRDEHFETTDVLGNEDDGSLLVKLSDGIGVRVQLVDTAAGSNAKSKSLAKNPIQLSVFFATTNGVRYRFVNSINSVDSSSLSSGEQLRSDACDCVFGKPVAKPKRSEIKAPPVPHADLLHDIRAAVASLQL